MRLESSDACRLASKLRLRALLQRSELSAECDSCIALGAQVRPEREAHAVMGVSMGGSAAVRIGIEYRESIGMAAEVAHGSCTDLPPQRKK